MFERREEENNARRKDISELRRGAIQRQYQGAIVV